MALLTRSIRIVSAGNDGGRGLSRREEDTLLLRRPHGRPPRLRKGSDPGRRVQADGPGRPTGSLSRPLPHGAQDARQHLHQGFIDQRIDDALDRPPFDAGRHGGAQCRLQVDRPRLLSRGRHRDRQQVPFQHRHLRPAAAIQNDKHESAQHPGYPGGQSGPGTTIPSCKYPNAANPGLPYRSDVEYPTVFWITNGWNDFIGNMAAGAGTCGAAYWLVPAANSDMVEVTADEHAHMNWSGYAALQEGSAICRHDPAQVLLQELRDVDDALLPDDRRRAAVPRRHRGQRHAAEPRPPGGEGGPELTPPIRSADHGRRSPT